MRISDWSSDVCSSDLARARQQRVAREGAVAGAGAAPPGGAPGAPGGGAGAPAPLHRRRAHHLRQGLAEGEELTLPWLPAREGEDGKAGQEAPERAAEAEEGEAEGRDAEGHTGGAGPEESRDGKERVRTGEYRWWP